MIRTLSEIYIVAIGISIILTGIIVGQKSNTIDNHPSAQIAEASTTEEETIDDREEILWLARIIYSETKRPQEQVLVGWVVRNRVESQVFGNRYKDVARASGQFSGLHASDNQYAHNITREYDSAGKAWKSAVNIARSVYYADASLRPFSKATRHFYSPRSVTRTPKWASGIDPSHVVKDPSSSSVRFAFYEGIK